MYFAISYQRIRTPISMDSHSLDANLIERCFGSAFEKILEEWQEFTSVLVALCSNECCFNFNKIVVKAASFEQLHDLLVVCIAFVATCYLIWKGISENVADFWKLKYQRYTWTRYVCCSRMQKLLDYTRTRQSLVWNWSMYAIDAASSFKGGGLCSNPKLSDEKVDGLIEVNCKLKLLENLANSLE